MDTDTSFLTLARVPAVLKKLLSLTRYRRKGIDCVWLQYGCLPDLAYLLVAKLCGFAVMVTPHLGSNWRSQSNPMLRGVSGWLLALADRLALISTTQEREIRLPKRVPRSYILGFLPENVLSGDVFEHVARLPEMQLIHSGRLSEGKGTFLFLDVCRGLREAGVPFYARITGGADDDVLSRIQDMIAAYELKQNVAVLGHVPEDELIQLLRKSDILVHLSTMDSYPAIVLESIACSTFPVCVGLPGATNMVRTYVGHVVNSAGAAAQTVGFLRGMKISEIRALSSEAALRVRRDYAWTQSASAVRSAIIETVRKPVPVTA